MSAGSTRLYTRQRDRAPRPWHWRETPRCRCCGIMIIAPTAVTGHDLTQLGARIKRYDETSAETLKRAAGIVAEMLTDDGRICRDCARRR
jgi:hypothetical protein